MSTLIQDLRYGLRMLAKNPGFTAVAVLTLASGIGANTAIFSAVNGVLLRPLPYREPNKLLMVWESTARSGGPHGNVAPANFVDFRAQNRVFDQIAAYHDQDLNLTGGGEPEKIKGQRVSASLISLLGVPPALGRAFQPEEDQPGANAAVVLSYGLWRRRFGGDPRIVGQTVQLDNRPTTVLGVMPPAFVFPSREAELWVPMIFEKGEAESRGDHYLNVIARIKPGVTQAQAEAEMNGLMSRLAAQYPRTNADRGVALVPLQEEFVGEMRRPLLILLGGVGFVLLIACANVATLQLTGAVARRKEVAIRASLGAPPWRIVRQLLTEGMLLSMLGGALGLLLAAWGVNLLGPLIPVAVSKGHALSLDGRVLIATLGVSLFAGVIFGLASALQISGLRLSEALKEGGRAGAGVAGRPSLRSLLVVTEVSLAFVLLMGAGLMVKSLLRLLSVNPGFQPEQVLTMRVELPLGKYSAPERRRAFYDQVLERIQSLPGVQAAGIISYLPLSPVGISFVFSIEGRTAPGEPNSPMAVFRVVSPDYFRTMGIPLLRGRTFGPQDRQDSPAVIVINRMLAERFWPGEQAIGKRIRIGPPDSPNPWAIIVGVVGDVKHQELRSELMPQMYVPYQQDRRGFVAPRDLVVRTTGDPLVLAASVRNEIWAVDKDQPVASIRTMEEVVSDSAAQPRFQALLLGLFAALALLLASGGIYGVVYNSVAQRKHEIGVRMALGARAGDALKLVLRQALGLTLLGLGTGLAGAAALTGLLSSMLYEVKPTDPLMFIVVPLVFAGVAMVASYIPARRATKVDPIVALRYE